VLSDFAKSDKEWRDLLLEAVSEKVDLLVDGQNATFQNKVHLALNPAPLKE
jgi:PTH1 family peptidyl-tRNA hydrolase